MHTDKENFKIRRFGIFSVFMCVHLWFVSCSFAQTTAPAGLETLSDERLISELASRGLTNLLDRAFEVNKVPPPQRDGMRALVALRQLSDSKLTVAQRRALVGKIAAGIE